MRSVPAQRISTCLFKQITSESWSLCAPTLTETHLT